MKSLSNSYEYGSRQSERFESGTKFGVQIVSADRMLPVGDTTPIAAVFSLSCLIFHFGFENLLWRIKKCCCYLLVICWLVFFCLFVSAQIIFRNS